MGSILNLLIGDKEQEPDDDRTDRKAYFYLKLGVEI